MIVWFKNCVHFCYTTDNNCTGNGSYPDLYNNIKYTIYIRK